VDIMSLTVTSTGNGSNRHLGNAARAADLPPGNRTKKLGQMGEGTAADCR
jgi:hypothetical protein